MPNTNNQASSREMRIRRRSVEEINQEFRQVGCLGHGGMGTSVFLAQKKSGRHVALKVMLHDDDDHCQECFEREVSAVSRLNKNDTEDDKRDLFIIFFEEWFTGPGFSCIVMQHVNGGTLAQEIHRRATTSNAEPFTERRIGWYALQLCEALAYAHERGVSHHDVKSSNCLIDLQRGGRLVLADFGSAVAPGEEPVGFSEIYASPELLAAHANEDYTGLDAKKVDAFGLGCILFELLCTKKLVELTGEQTLAEFIRDHGVDTALDLPNIRLPWLPSDQAADGPPPVIGYSSAILFLVRTLLEPDPSQRWLPSKLQEPLRNDPQSPLLANSVIAAQPLVPGVPVTIDNVQLGMFVQQGPDWEEGENVLYGGRGTVGVIIKLDPDGLYAEVAWPVQFRRKVGTTLCCRIGAGSKYELAVGPTPMNDFCKGGSQPIPNGLVRYENVSSFDKGQLLNSNCMVLGVNDMEGFVLVAPLEKIWIPPIAAPPTHFPNVEPSIPHKTRTEQPKHWQPSQGLFVDVTDMDEKSGVLERFHSTDGGIDIQDYEITSVKRIQCPELWELYTATREGIAAENWGLANEQLLFHGTKTTCPEEALLEWSNFYQNCSYGGRDIASREIHFSGAKWANENGHRKGTGERKIVLSRVTLGRVLDRSKKDLPAFSVPDHSHYHSEEKKCNSMSPRVSRRHNYMVFAIRCTSQAVPEYVVTYKPLRDGADRPMASTSSRGMPLFINGIAVRIPGHPRQPRPGRQEAARSSPTPFNFGSSSTGAPSPFTTTRPGAIASAGRPVPQRRSRTSSERSRPRQVTVANGLDTLTSTATQVPGTAMEHNGSFASRVAKANAAEPKEPPKEEAAMVKPSPSKMCVVCLSKPVCRILLPCGHPCLCEICSTEQGLAKLKRKCPECRKKIREAVTIYGRVVDD